jgi:uncharacterized protein YbjT (DUF2867 family)
VLRGTEVAYYLVHGTGAGPDWAERDRQAAATFARAAEDAGLARIVYLGGVAPPSHPSEHLASRIEVGRILRAGKVPTIELRAAMIVGPGSASWQIVRDLALRLPVMVLPAWLASRSSPLALTDAVRALADAIDVPLRASECFDLPGPDTLSAKEILEHVAALEGRRVPSVSLPWLTPRLSALWLRLVTRAEYALARELVLGLTDDLLPRDDRFWGLIGRPPLTDLWRLEEALVRTTGPSLFPAG